ncbi:hypothetical protein JVT61DRAFT_9101 [Boletus reticuloceps]|uniref:Uncharacterized protein n=1 Tax=Boletus reticuloceps TaxID=495285 RepID=A0A8I3A6Q7_9AGAM|nr:hypothetical protein JVT61DRAFT_9101 [Boletus reticuloceps]
MDWTTMNILSSSVQPSSLSLSPSQSPSRSPSRSPSQSSSRSPSILPWKDNPHDLSFVLSSDQVAQLERPSNFGFNVNTSDYCKQVLNIDLEKVPGRTRRWSGLSGPIAAKQDDTAPPAPNHLLKDPDLASVGCAYLPDYNIIVCLNVDKDGKPCRAGIPLAELLTHCYCAHSIPFCKRGYSKQQGSVTPIQKDFIYRILSRYPDIIATLHELRDLRPRADQKGPIAHILGPIDGAACTRCDFSIWIPKSDSKSKTDPLRTHWAMHVNSSPGVSHARRGRDLLLEGFFKRCSIQSFDHKRGVWMRVLSGQATSHSGPRKTFDQLLASSNQRLQVSVIADRTPLLPFFQQNRAYNLVSPLSAAEISRLIALPAQRGPDSHLYKLKKIVISRFRKLCEAIPKASGLIRELLVMPRPGEKQMIDRFNCPIRQSTISAYALEEVRLLCFILRCVQKKWFSVEGSLRASQLEGYPHIELTQDQHKISKKLFQIIEAPDTPSSTLESIVDAILKSIYMPSNTLSMLENPFINPSAVYTVFRSLRQQGGFDEPKTLTVYYARIQFGIRLTVMHTIQEEYQATKDLLPPEGDDNHELYDQFMSKMRDLINRWATEDHISPLSFVLECMRAMSRIARRAPSRCTVMWDLEDKQITVLNHSVVINQYFKAVQKSLFNLARKVSQDILFGIEFPDESLNLPSAEEETHDTDTIGFGLFSLPIDNSDGTPSPAAYFLEELTKRGEICHRDGDQIIWNHQKLHQWLLDLSSAWSEMFTLMHLLALPARGSEMTIWQHSNSSISSRHLFFSKSLQTLITQSNYNKTSAITGLYKHILRPIPFPLATILTKLLRIIRPVETFAFTSQVTERDRQAIREVYGTYIFISNTKVWDSCKLSAALKAWFIRELQVPFGLSLHRHFAQALQRKFLTDKNKNMIEKVANQGFGHGQEVAGLNYAREGGDLNIDATARQMMERVGAGWIQMHGIQVSS